MMVATHSVLTVGTSLSVKRVEAVFSQCFAHSTNTRLCGGFDEPLYRPVSTGGQINELRYRKDFFSSALHEASHWCIAGPARRLQTDFGYWYTPDGRNRSQQTAFENVEYKPQALEWFFSRACGHRFRISVDNLDAGTANDSADNVFELRVLAQARAWCKKGLPVDAGRFFQALCREFDTAHELSALKFSLSELNSG